MLAVWPHHRGFGRLPATSKASVQTTAILLFALSFLAEAVWAGGASSAPAATTRPPFATYHDELDRTVSQILQRAEASRQQPAATLRETPLPARPGDERIREFARQYWRGREQSFREALERLEELRPTLGGILRAEGLPEALVAVVLVESAARPLALSPKQARGLWQFIPATARRYGLVVEGPRDDRIQFERATRAAARYLRDLYEQFGAWPLALAAYNAGEQAVARALEGASGADFWTLSARKLLPTETRNYVPAVLDAIELLGGEAFQTGKPAKAHAPDRVYAGTSPAG